MGCNPIACWQRDERDTRFANPTYIATPWGAFVPTAWPKLYVAADGPADADGSIDKPFQTISEAIAEAVDAGPDESTIVLVADGSYRENLVIEKSITVWGTCWQTTVVESADPQAPALSFGGVSLGGATGMTIRAAGDAVAVSGAGRVVVGRVRIEPTGRGVRISAGADTLISELAIVDGSDSAIHIDGARAQVDDATIRSAGVGLSVQGGSLELKRSLVEHGAGGVVGSGAMTSIIETAIFGLPDVAGPGVRLERGAAAGDDEVTLTMKRSLVDSSRDAGVELSDVGADIEHSVIRGTAGLVGDGHTASRSGCAGQGLRAGASQGGHTITLRESLIEHSTTAGIQVHRAGLELDGVLVRDTAPEACSGGFGDGIAAYDSAAVSLRGSRVEASARAALVSFGSEVSIGETALGCSQQPAGLQAFGPRPPRASDEGAVVCGCDALWSRCAPASSGLEPWMTEAP